MTQQYQDMYMRDFAGDTGLIPSTARETVSASPDIIPIGTDPKADYETFYKNNYNGPYNYYSNIVLGQYNYIYIRVKNLFTGAQTGTVKLYYALPTLLLMPSVWINNNIPNSNNTDHANVSAAATNDVVVGVGPFYWSPPPLPPTDNHYCLISQVITTQNPNPIPSDSSLGQFAQWVKNKPGVAWRNVSLVTITTNPNYQNFVGIENPESNPVLATITATCKNIPDETVIKIVGALSGPAPPIDKTETVGPENQTQPPPNKENIISLVTTLPANFKERLDLRGILPSGIQPPPDSSITLSYYLNVSSNDPYAKIGVEPEALKLTSGDIGFSSGGKMLLLGDYTFVFKQ